MTARIDPDTLIIVNNFEFKRRLRTELFLKPQIHCICDRASSTVVPPNTTALPILPPIFKSQIQCVLYVICVFGGFWNTAAFCQSKIGVIEGVDCTIPCIQLNIFVIEL